MCLFLSIQGCRYPEFYQQRSLRSHSFFNPQCKFDPDSLQVAECLCFWGLFSEQDLLLEFLTVSVGTVSSQELFQLEKALEVQLHLTSFWCLDWLHSLLGCCIAKCTCLSMPKLDNYGQEFPYTAEWVKCAKALSVYLRLSLDQLAATKKMGLGRLRVRA